MNYKIGLNTRVKKFLAKHEDTAKIFFKKIKILSTNILFTNLDIKPLKGQKNHYRLRIGKYRFLYEVIDKQILIYFYEANSRGDVYK